MGVVSPWFIRRFALGEGEREEGVVLGAQVGAAGEEGGEGGGVGELVAVEAVQREARLPRCSRDAGEMQPRCGGDTKRSIMSSSVTVVANEPFRSITPRRLRIWNCGQSRWRSLADYMLSTC